MHPSTQLLPLNRNWLVYCNHLHISAQLLHRSSCSSHPLRLPLPQPTFCFPSLSPNFTCSPTQTQTLLALANNNPAMLHMLGASPEMLQRELARHKAAAKWRGMTPADKAAADRETWSAWLTRYRARLQQEAAAGATAEQRVKVMNSSNPRIVLRNWVAQEVIEAAEKGDYEPVRQLLAELKRPYDDVEPAAAAGSNGAAADMQVEVVGGGGEGHEGKPQVCVWRQRFGGKAPAWAADLCVTCSS